MTASLRPFYSHFTLPHLSTHTKNYYFQQKQTFFFEKIVQIEFIEIKSVDHKQVAGANWRKHKNILKLFNLNKT